MIRWDDVLSEETGKELDTRIARSVQVELQAIRAQRRRTWLAYFVPATMGALGAVAWLKLKSLSSEVPKHSDAGAEDVALAAADPSAFQSAFEGVDMDDEMFAILEDLELLENLEVLEKWNS